MFWRQTANTLRQDWQTTIDASLEAGQSPVLDLGSSQQMLQGLPVLAALRSFAVQRVDVATPTLLIGGDAAVWLALLLQVRSPSEMRRSPEPALVFAGPDVATYLASLTTLTPERPPEAVLLPRATPPAVRPLLLPPAAAQLVLPWETLPFAVTAEAQATAAPPTVAANRDKWLGWCAIGLVVLLLLAALAT
ncbi:MAG: hypothetical protein U0350_13170 [Caldilineaceae bacterium]